MATDFEYNFPAIRGVQASREYYVSMCPLRLIPRIFLFNEEELVPELRAQRQLNKTRIPELCRYITDNKSNYVFSAITASIDGKVKFNRVKGSGEASQIGILQIPMSARFIINDGQHRRAAIEAALKESPEIADETIAVVFFMDHGLERCQQMFADLNRNAIRPSKSLGVLYDHRDDRAQLIKLVVLKSSLFKDVVEMEKSTLSPRSRRLFTLSAIYSATAHLLSDVDIEDPEKRADLATSYWEEVSKYIKEWKHVSAGKLTSGEVRSDFIHSHGVVLQALGRVGNALLLDEKARWKTKLKGLKNIDWRRANSSLWEGRALIGGQVSKARQNVVLTTNAIKSSLGVELLPEEQRVEDAFMRGEA